MKQQIGAGHVKNIGKNLAGAEFVCSSQSLRHHRSADKEIEGVVSRSISLLRPTIDEPVATFEYPSSHLFLALLCQHGIKQSLIQRLGGQAQVGTVALLSILQCGERGEHDPLEFRGE